MQDKFHITLVRSRIKNRPYTKTDGFYSGPTWNNNIGLQTINNTPEDVLNILQVLQNKSDTCMVVGKAVRPEIIDTDRTMKNFKEAPVTMLVLDLDKHVSPNMEKKKDDISYFEATEDADSFISKYLPPEFHNTSYILRFSSSFLLKEEPYLRCHLIFILAEPQYPREIGMWLRQDKIPADATFYFNLTQPIFTAAPIWKNIVDPLAIKDTRFPRVSLVQKEMTHVVGNWQPYYVPKRSGNVVLSALPAASRLPGRIGSFCRMVEPSKALTTLGYTDEGENRYLAPSSETGIPGAIVFDNGYMFSHHEGDPINRIVSEIYKNKRQSLNSHDVMRGWAVLNKDVDPTFLKEFEFMMAQAITNDSAYQEEIQQELVHRCEWLVEGDYESQNRKIIDGVIRDMHQMGASQISREYIFHAIKAKTKHINVNALKNTWKGIQKDSALNKDSYDPEANLRNMASLFKKQHIIHAHHKTMSGDFWCYFSKMKIWKRCNPAQTQAFVYNHIHAAIPVKVEIDYFRTEQLTRIIMREACLSITDFHRGLGWAFKGGRYGILMGSLFSPKGWTIKKAIKTLHKNDHIHKELPITYEQWKNKQVVPENYIDFLIASCEEDMESVELLREYGGYIMCDSYYLHKMLILEGVPGSGKSILAKVLQAMVGSSFHAAVSITRISSRFGLGDLPGKKLAVMSEARGADFATLKAVVPVLLKITGQDYMDTEAKHKTQLSELLECKILMMTNRTPVIPDDTGALAQRLMMIRFNRCFRGTKEEILGLDKKILSSGIASIIHWHLKGLERLSKRQEFIEPRSGIAAKKILLEQIDPLKTFIDTFFSVNQSTSHDNWMVQKDFIEYFRAYLKRLGQYNEERRDAAGKRASIRNIQSLYPAIRKHRVHVDADEGIKYVWKLTGLCQRVELSFEFAEELAAIQ